MSFAIFNSEMAIVFNNPDSADCASVRGESFEFIRRAHEGKTRDGGNLRRHALAESPGGEFNPVPTAVPPMASSSK